MIFESLDGSFGSIDTLVAGLDELEFDVSWIEVGFDYFCSLIVHDIQLWFVTLVFEVFKVLLVRI